MTTRKGKWVSCLRLSPRRVCLGCWLLCDKSRLAGCCVTSLGVLAAVSSSVCLVVRVRLSLCSLAAPGGLVPAFVEGRVCLVCLSLGLLVCLFVCTSVCMFVCVSLSIANLPFSLLSITPNSLQRYPLSLTLPPLSPPPLSPSPSPTPPLSHGGGGRAVCQRKMIFWRLIAEVCGC